MHPPAGNKLERISLHARHNHDSLRSVFCSCSYNHRALWTHKRFVSQPACALYSPSRASSRKAARPGTVPAMACHDNAVIGVSCCGCRSSSTGVHGKLQATALHQPMLERVCLLLPTRLGLRPTRQHADRGPSNTWSSATSQPNPALANGTCLSVELCIGLPCA